MIYRCSQDMLGGRWCSICGKCTCTTRNEHGSRVWSGAAKPSCPMHGATTVHPLGKVIDYDYVRGEDGIPMKVETARRLEGWDLAGTVGR
jgi:hypothetical protein